MFAPEVLLKSEELFEADAATSQYERAREISKYLLMHYGSTEDVFDRPDHPLTAAHGYPTRLSETLREAAARTGVDVRTALDVGCNVGGVTQALSTWVRDEVVGIDISPRAVEVARAVSVGNGGVFCVAQLGPFAREVQVRLPSAEGRANVDFRVGDATALHEVDGVFDAVLLSNVLDRVPDPVACLEQLSASERTLRAGGLLMIACPWSWYPEYSDPTTWLGSASARTSSETALKARLAPRFDLVREGDEAGVLRQNPREYDYFEAHVSVWRKK
ncbi:methyltransferase domain-containing protein [Actinokineospora auranticolor]|uniref:Methyltransferase family protein n=1 Tax=Actinokineospora auranticolor TaxID=155976 RepID=A0A2S6GMT7_9PSEU|nr:methyltransferase domain-containing protein [Actinokineospora auranticolor]PPK66527.1 methyltransferase family protein [Actinokineospora auranticolor]